MELAFQTSRLPFLKRVLQETRCQEETAETIVPDSCPDIASVVDSFAETVIRGKDCRDGSVTISGGIKGGILYLPEDNSWPRVLDFYIPFTMKFEHPSLTENARILCSSRVRSVDGRLINSRKAMLRVGLGCSVMAYEQQEETLFTLQEHSDELQTKVASYGLQLPLETGEKSFVISDTLELPAGHPPVSQVYKLQCQLDLSDQKLVGNKAVFKGTALCKFLYLSEDQTLCLYQQQLPFSQYCELQTDYDEEQAEILPILTGYDLEVEGQEASRAMVTMHVLAQCVVSGNKTVSLIEDAYCTQGKLIPAWKDYAMDVCLDRQHTMQTVRQHLSGGLQELLDTDVYVDYPAADQKDGSTQITVPVQIHVLGYDHDRTLCALTGKGQTEWKMALDDQARCVAEADQSGSCYTSVLSDGAEVRCEIALHAVCYADQKLRTLSGGSMEAAPEQTGGRPSVILRKVPGRTELWDIAKACSAREEAIRAANHLEDENLPEDRLLLIPVG